MKPADFIKLAGTLSVQQDAARLRTSISRAYYGAFHLALEFLTDLGIRCGKSHDLHTYLMASRNSVARDAGIFLADLYAFRQKADYELSNLRMESSSESQHCVERTRRIESLLQQCSLEPIRTEIKTSIEKYQQQMRPKA